MRGTNVPEYDIDAGILHARAADDKKYGGHASRNFDYIIVYLVAENLQLQQ